MKERDSIKQPILVILREVIMGAGFTFDWLFFDNSKLIDFDDKNVSFLRKKIYIIERERERDREREKEPNLT